MEPLLDVKNLSIYFKVQGRELPAVKDLSFSLGQNEVLGIVGESGSGKSITSLAVMGLLPKTGCRVEGEIWFEGQNLLSLSASEMEKVRGDRLSMIFQEPMTSLNPVHTCGDQIMESILLHTKATKKEARDKALSLLERCGIPDPVQRFKEYPHQLSGGMRQRIMIAIALACDPALLIADEPTTALDVTIQAQILQLMQEIRAEQHTSILMITHDLGVVSDFCDRVAVVYTGQVVETAPVRQLFTAPRHPYTRGLLAAIPRLGHSGGRLTAIEGMVPDMGHMPEGCHFHPRCPFAQEQCREAAPALSATADGRQVRCFYPQEGR